LPKARVGFFKFKSDVKFPTVSLSHQFNRAFDLFGRPEVPQGYGSSRLECRSHFQKSAMGIQNDRMGFLSKRAFIQLGSFDHYGNAKKQALAPSSGRGHFCHFLALENSDELRSIITTHNLSARI
jgi:hypothetical protein